MRLIVGLGNPGNEYDQTRHNAGFLAIDKLCEKLNCNLDKNKFNAIYGIYSTSKDKIIIAKPQTYMNMSGEAVLELMNYYAIDISDLIVIHDDLDLPLGKIRLRYQGSCGGQNGMRNIIDLLGSEQINRIRLGISNDKSIDTKDYVLGKLSKEEFKILSDVAVKAAEAVIYSFDHNFDEVMTKFN